MRTVSVGVMAEPEYLTQEEAAKLLRVSTRFLRRETAAGFIPAIRLGSGRPLRYAREDLDRYMRERRDSPPQDPGTT